MRADQLLVERGLAASRSQAVRLIAGGLRWREPGADAPWRSVAKNRDDVPDAAELELVDAAEARYVSRGGLKLEGALRIAGIDFGGKHCLDVGQSTGGFTDCLLQHGAGQVVGIDVGHGQLHARLAADARVMALERINARSLQSFQWPRLLIGTKAAAESRALDARPVGPIFDVIVADLSFISLTLVLPALVPLLAIGGDMLMLVKPQFELQPGQIGKGGVVRDPALYGVVEDRLRQACADLGLVVHRWFESPIAGGDGNREFFIHATMR
ncbi:MAG: TlyA family RNA methyltransferase [Variovorax sp.]